MNDKISGSKARRWRRKVASYSSRPSDYVRTLKFPLDMSGLEPVDFNAVSSLYETTEGIGKGSLAGLLCAVHLCGFRLFPTKGQAQTFFNTSQLLNDKFRDGWKEFTGVLPKSLSPGTIIELVQKSPRSRNGQPVNYETKPIAAYLYKDATGRSIEAEPSSDDLAHHALLTFEYRLKDMFPERLDVANHADEALKLFDKTMADCGFKLPSILTSYSSFKDLKVKNSTIVFDPDLPRVSPSSLENAMFHAVVAQKLGTIPSDSPSVKELQDKITTHTNSGLSWLFGSGFIYWRDTSLKTIVEEYEIPPEAHDAVDELQKWFKAVDDDILFGSSHYSDFRTSVGGKIDSWIANYYKRLEEIKKVHEGIDLSWELPSELREEKASRYLSGIGLTADQLEENIHSLTEKRDHVHDSLTRLKGQSDDLPSEEDVKKIEDFSDDLDSLAGVFAAIQNLVKQDEDSVDQQDPVLANTLTLPDWLKPLPKINRISGGLPGVEEELQKDQEQLKELQERASNQLDRVLSWSNESGKLSDPISNIESRERQQFPNKAIDHEIQARRWMLNRLARRAINGTDSLKRNVQVALSSLFEKERELNRLLFNAQGAIYRSPASRSRHQGYSLDEDLLRKMDILDLLNQVKDKADSDFKANPDLEHYKDRLQIESLVTMFQLYRLPNEIPTELIEKEYMESSTTRVPASLTLALNLDVMQREALIKYMNLYISEASGILARLFRKTFTLKTKFLRVNANTLYYIPKERNQNWMPPPHYYSSSGVLSNLLQSEFSNGLEEGISSQSLREFITSKQFETWKNEDVGSFLAQAPHDWFLDLGIKDLSNLSLHGLPTNKKGGVASRGKKLIAPARLIGPSSYKTLLDNRMKRNNVLEFGEYNLMFLQTFDQEATVDETGNIKVNVQPREVLAEVAITVKDTTMHTPNTHPLSEAVIGIDLGEAGIGYTVFNTQDMEGVNNARPISSGTIPIRSIRNLIRSVRHHRNKVQPRQKFQQRHSTALEELRNNVVGDIAHHIDNLCRRYKGFPVLESSVRNLASGSKQLQLVYDRILNLYTYSGIDAHKNIRQHHWCGGQKWEHPHLLREKKEMRDGKIIGSGNWETLPLHPGVSVHPSGTSQTCSACKRNPIEIVKSREKDRFDIEEGGKVQLPEGNLLLRRKSDPKKSERDRLEEQRKYRKRKLNPPYQYPYKPGNIGFDDLIKAIRQQLRQPQDSVRSKDTTQSRYFCPFEDCQSQMHADENAAINIVRKWVKDKGIKLSPSPAKS